MVVLSLFDGMSCGRIALDRVGITPSKYFASEIDKNAIKVSKDNWRDITYIGDVTKVSYENGILHTENGDFETKIDLLIGGSPCQDFSSLKALAGNGVQGLLGEKSGLFYEYLRIKKEIGKCDWLLENVKMKGDSKKELDGFIGSVGVLINSSLVSYQKRARYYWSSLPLFLPKDKNINFQNYKQNINLDEYIVNKTKSRIKMWSDGEGRNSQGACANVTSLDKIYCLTTKQDRCPNSGLVAYKDFCRYLTRAELEGAQTVPLGYTKCLSYGQASAVLGNGWTIDVIAHIFKSLPQTQHDQQLKLAA